MIFSQVLLAALQELVVGQEYAVTAVTRAVVMALAGMYPRNGPLAVLMFAGPTGSGKTHVARSLGRILFGSDRGIIHIDCQQIGQAADPFGEFHKQMFGHQTRHLNPTPQAAPPISILLFEHLDKAPAPFLENLASAFDWGHVLIKGACLSLSNTIVILTITLSRRQVEQFIGRTIGFFSDGEPGADLTRRHIMILEEMDHMIGATMVTRTDEIILFERLSEQHVARLLDKSLATLQNSLGICGIRLIVNADARSFLLLQGLEDLTHGTRQIDRVVKNVLEFPLADLALSGRLTPGTTVSVSHQRPRSFLNFQIATPWLLSPTAAPLSPITLERSSIG